MSTLSDLLAKIAKSLAALTIFGIVVVLLTMGALHSLGLQYAFLELVAKYLALSVATLVVGLLLWLCYLLLKEIWR